MYFNLNSHKLRGERALTSAEVIEYILNRGHEIVLHGSNHRAERTFHPIEGIQDILENRLELEQTYGIIVRGMAYPESGSCTFTSNTDYNSVRRYLTELDVAYAHTVGGDDDSFMLPQDWYAWMPTAHHSNPTLHGIWFDTDGKLYYVKPGETLLCQG